MFWDDSTLIDAAENGHTNTIELLLNRRANTDCLSDTFGMSL